MASIEMGAADLDDVVPLACLVGERRLQRPATAGSSPADELDGRGDVHGGGEGVVGGLAHVDVVVGVHRVLDPKRPADQLDGPVAITSLTFMLDWVPDPVCHTYSGKLSSRAPAVTSSATWAMRSAFHFGSRPVWPLTMAAAFLT